jgi:hypothetical protein
MGTGFEMTSEESEDLISWAGNLILQIDSRKRRERFRI